MKRLSLTICASVVALLGLVGCDNASKPTTDKAPDKAKPAATTAAPKTAAPNKTAAAKATAKDEGNAKDAKDEGDKDQKGDAAIPDIPDTESKPPSVDEWKAAKEVNSQEANSRPAKCYMKIVREWLKVNCGGKVTKIEENKELGFGRENVDYFTSLKEGLSADIVVRLKKGKNIRAKIHRTDGEKSAALFVSWPAKEPKPTIIALGISAT